MCPDKSLQKVGPEPGTNPVNESLKGPRPNVLCITKQFEKRDIPLDSQTAPPKCKMKFGGNKDIYVQNSEEKREKRTTRETSPNN